MIGLPSSASGYIAAYEREACPRPACDLDVRGGRRGNPHGDPSVTDAERSAAGRETIAARWQALLPGNRSRAAAQYAAGGLPEGQEVVRVW